MAETQIAATHAAVHELAANLDLDEAAYSRALEIAGLVPTRADWIRYISRFLMAIGVLLIVAGIAAFFAANWDELGHLAKFALVQLGILLAVVIAWRLGLDSVGGKACLLAAAFLVGVLLALFGQVYQTGADPYGLFLTWALLILPWALIGRQAGLWILVVVLADLALIMYWTQVLYPPDGWWILAQLLGPVAWLGTTVMDWRLASWVFAVNAASLVVWEFLAARGIAWMQGRSFSRVVAVLALATVVPPTLLLIFGAAVEERFRLSVVSPALYAAATVGCLFYYRYQRHDLFMLTVCLAGAVLVVTALWIRYLFADIISLLFLALLLIAEVAAVAWWLRLVVAQWESES